MNNIFQYLKDKINNKTILVIAGNYQQFKLFCNEKMMDYEEGNIEFEGVEFIYYDENYKIKGYRFDDFIKFGTWWNRNDIDWNGTIYPSMKVDYWSKIVLKEE